MLISLIAGNPNPEIVKLRLKRLNKLPKELLLHPKIDKYLTPEETMLPLAELKLFGKATVFL